jgi:hypothetical protein
MKKEDIELIIIKVSANGQDAINMKIYKNGTTCRYGVGGLPQLGIGMISFVGDARYFEPLLMKVPQEILEQSKNKEEPAFPNGYIEYVIVFYGDSKNGDTGERAEWTKSTGIRVKIDQNSNFFSHPIMKVLDGLTMEAAELTNELYFDVMMLAKWNAKSSTIPEQTIINQPKTEAETQQNYANYISQMIGSARKWNMAQFTKNKTYEIEGNQTIAKVNQQGNNFGIRFIPPEMESVDNILMNTQLTDNETKKKKPWWKF